MEIEAENDNSMEGQNVNQENDYKDEVQEKSEIPFSPIQKNSLPFTPRTPMMENKNFVDKSNEESLGQNLKDMRVKLEINSQKLQLLEQNMASLTENSRKSRQIMVCILSKLSFSHYLNLTIKDTEKYFFF